MKYKQWNQVASDPAAVAALERAGLPTLAAMTLCARGLDTAEKAEQFLASGRELLGDPMALRDMDRAVERLRRALEEGEQRTLLQVRYADPDQPPGEGRETTLWFDPDTHALVEGEISVDGLRVIRCTISEFTIGS